MLRLVANVLLESEEAVTSTAIILSGVMSNRALNVRCSVHLDDGFGIVAIVSGDADSFE